jgi:ribosome-binding factor A
MLKAAEAIREVVSMAILTEIRDPRVQNVTVTGVEVTPDMRAAKVLVSVMADEPKQHLCLKGLANSTGFLQSKIAKRVETRYTPKITFELDQGVKKSIEVQRILYELAEERKQREQGQAADSAATGEEDDGDALDVALDGDALDTSDARAALESAEDAAADADGKTS